MRGNHHHPHLVLDGLHLLDLHSFWKREQGVSFHHDLVSSNKLCWKEVYHIFSRLWPLLRGEACLSDFSLFSKHEMLCVGKIQRDPSGHVRYNLINSDPPNVPMSQIL